MNLSLRNLAGSIVLALGLLLTGCGSADIGEECETPSATDECVDGAICTNEGTGNVCRKICDVMEDCPSGSSCNGVSGGSTKSCQPDPI